eukprot:72914_1
MPPFKCVFRWDCLVICIILSSGLLLWSDIDIVLVSYIHKAHLHLYTRNRTQSVYNMAETYPISTELPIHIDFDTNCSWLFQNKSLFPRFTQQMLYKLFFTLAERNTNVIFIGDSVTRRSIFQLNHFFNMSELDFGPTWHIGFQYKYNVANVNHEKYVMLNDTAIAEYYANKTRQIVTKSEWLAFPENVTRYFNLLNKTVFEANKMIYVIGIGSHSISDYVFNSNFTGYEDNDQMLKNATNHWDYLLNDCIKTIYNITKQYRNVTVIFRTQTSIPRAEKLVLLWNKLLLKNIQYYQRNSTMTKQLFVYDPYRWSHQRNWTEYYSVLNNEVFRKDPWGTRFTFWNRIRNTCTPCEDIWRCIHFNARDRMVLLEQTLHALQYVSKLNPSFQ